MTINPFDADIGGGDLEQTLKLALAVGPLGRALREHPELADTVVDAVRDVLSTISLRTACECLALSGLFWPGLAECDLKTTLINHP